MSHNTFGHLFRVTTWGESHGPAIGCVVDGCPPRIADLRGRDPALAWTSAGPASRASPPSGASRTRSASFPASSPTRRPAQLLTTGTPISLAHRERRRPLQGLCRDQGQMYRPGHADFTYEAKYGIRDWRGSGRASARETAARVAAGAIARKVVPGMIVRGALVQIGPHAIDRTNWDWDEVDHNPFFCARCRDRGASGPTISTRSASAAPRSAPSSRSIADGVPAGLGAPIYGKLDQDIASGADVDQRRQGRRDRRRLRRRRASPARRTPTRCAWAMTASRMFLSNNAGGILGGISTGQPIVARFAVKPTSSILTPRRTVNQRRRGGRGLDQGPPRPLRRHPRRADRRSDAGDRPRRPLSPPPRPGRLSAGIRTNDQRNRTGCAMPSAPSPRARSSSSPTTTTARTRAT